MQTDTHTSDQFLCSSLIFQGRVRSAELLFSALVFPEQSPAMHSFDEASLGNISVAEIKSVELSGHSESVDSQCWLYAQTTKHH